MDWKSIEESVSTDSSDGAVVKKRLSKKDKANSGLLFPSSKISTVCNSRLWNMDSCWNWHRHAHRNLVEKKQKQWYFLSKTLAEDAAWKFVREKGIDLVVINPGLVIGPLLQPRLNTSSAITLNLLNGAETYPNTTFGWVNVKDVVNAHILAFENPSANGRYCLVESVAHNSEIVKILRELYPTLQLPEKCADDKPFMPTYQVSKERAKSIGVEFTPLEESLKETVESLKEKNLF